MSSVDLALIFSFISDHLSFETNRDKTEPELISVSKLTKSKAPRSELLQGSPK